MTENRGLWRGKRLDNGEWVEGYLSKSRNINEKPAFLKWCIDHEEKGAMMSCIVDPSTLGECTGLTDKNGKRIFEEDIVKFGDDYYKIEYIEKYSRFAPRKTGTVFASFLLGNSVIVGNIHDNPELLKGANDEYTKIEWCDSTWNPVTG